MNEEFEFDIYPLNARYNPARVVYIKVCYASKDGTLDLIGLGYPIGSRIEH